MVERELRAASVGARDVAIGACVASAVVHVWLVPQHTDQPLLAAGFAAAAAAAGAVAVALSLPRYRFAPGLAVALFGVLLVAYPVVQLVSDAHVDTLDLATKVVESAGLVGALLIEPSRDHAPLAPLDVLSGVLVAVLLVSALGHAHT